MRLAIRAVSPNAVVHLGDYYDDALTIQEECPHIAFHIVPGNCDRGRLLQPAPEMLCYDVCGIRLYMTHGHVQYVKQDLYHLLHDARKYDAKAALYGHTHIADCHTEDDGLWVLNPGSCMSYGGSVGLIETKECTIQSCRILRQRELEEML